MGESVVRGRVRTGWRVALVGLAALVGLLPGWADAQEASIRFDGDGDLVLDDGGQLELVSDALEDHSLHLRLVMAPLPPEAAGTRPVPATDVVLFPATVTVPRQQRVKVPIHLADRSKLALGDGVRGHIEALDGDPAGPVIARRAIVVRAAAEVRPAAKPATKAWTVRKGRLLAQDEGTTLPLAADGLAPAVVGVLQAKDGSWIEVTRQPEADGTTSGRRLALDFGKPAAGTTYTGSIDLDPKSDAGNVEVTLNSTDGLLAAVLAMSAGVLLGLGSKWTVGTFLPTRRLRKDAKGARDAAMAVQSAFASEVERLNRQLEPGITLHGFRSSISLGSVGGFSISEDVTAKYERALARSKALWTGPSFAIDRSGSDYTATIRAVEALEKAQGWGRPAADELERLLAAIIGVDWVEPPPGVSGPVPVLVAAAAHVTGQGGLALELSKVEEFRELTRWFTSTIEGFSGLVTELLRRGRSLRLLGGRDLGSQDQSLLRTATLEVDSLHWQVWHADGPDELEAARIEERLARVDELIGRLSRHFATHLEIVPVAGVDERTEVFDLMQFSGLGDDRSRYFAVSGIDVPAMGRVLVNTISRRARAVVGSVERGARVVLTGWALVGVILLIFFAAIAGGLGTVVSDEAFGSVRDYITAVVWGLGATAVAEGVEVALGAAFGPRKPAATAGAATAAS